ncbi:DUF982 domain-containing protein, partial [Ochrobactrum sp. 3-3]|uniref:DUF982 domain-containing protein n=1 Tax=Ochrobactrum sp. 3-3 TaxID=1830124 RepID=UPI0013B3725C
RKIRSSPCHKNGIQNVATQPSEPVYLFAGASGGTHLCVEDPVKAAEILLRLWPRHIETGPAHLKARKKLLSCLQGKCDLEAARKAFVSAAKEANLLSDRTTHFRGG